MHKLFWAANGSAPATLIIDGVATANTGTEEQNQAMVKFGEARQWPCEKAITEQQGKDGKYAKCLQIAINGDSISIRSNFVAKEGDRPQPYMYLSDDSNIATAIADIKRLAEQTGNELNAEELTLAAEDIANYQTKGRDKERERLTNLGGGWEKMWYHVRRH